MLDSKHKKNLDAYGEITDSAVVCPFCFTEDEDAWEYNLSNGDSTVVSCGECNQDFQVECSILVDYTSRKLP